MRQLLAQPIGNAGRAKVLGGARDPDVVRLGIVPVHARGGADLAVDLENREDMVALGVVQPRAHPPAGLTAIADEADRELASGEQLLDQGGLVIGREEPLHAFTQLSLVVDDGGRTHAHAGSFSGGLDEARELQRGVQRLIERPELLEGSRRQPRVAPDVFGARFV